MTCCSRLNIARLNKNCCVRAADHSRIVRTSDVHCDRAGSAIRRMNRERVCGFHACSQLVLRRGACVVPITIGIYRQATVSTGNSLGHEGVVDAIHICRCQFAAGCQNSIGLCQLNSLVAADHSCIVCANDGHIEKLCSNTAMAVADADRDG